MAVEQICSCESVLMLMQQVPLTLLMEALKSWVVLNSISQLPLLSCTFCYSKKIDPVFFCLTPQLRMLTSSFTMLEITLFLVLKKTASGYSPSSKSDASLLAQIFSLMGPVWESLYFSFIKLRTSLVFVKSTTDMSYVLLV